MRDKYFHIKRMQNKNISGNYIKKKIINWKRNVKIALKNKISEKPIF